MCDTKDMVVLVIDDCQDNLFLMETILLEDNYRVETASSGEEGIQKIHQIVPDLIILDMMMPGMNGAAVIEQLKTFPHLARIPIIICTANVYLDRHELEFAAGICYKPIDINDVLAKVNSLIACCNGTTNSSTRLDIDPDRSLDIRQKMLANSDSESMALEKLRSPEYKTMDKLN